MAWSPGLAPGGWNLWPVRGVWGSLLSRRDCEEGVCLNVTVSLCQCERVRNCEGGEEGLICGYDCSCVMRFNCVTGFLRV